MGFTLTLSRRFRAFTRPAWFATRRRRSWFARARGGAAAVEFALVSPVLIALLMGIVTYGSYFLTAHTVQQIANDSARAAIAGLDDNERTQLAENAAIAGMAAAQPYMKGVLIGVTVSRNDTLLSVRLSYDASRDVWTHLLVPAPSTTITRTASIQLGGY